jgi:hypothetical protein
MPLLDLSFVILTYSTMSTLSHRVHLLGYVAKY